MRKNETLNLRVSAEFKKRLMAEAKKERRSVTNYLEATLSSLWKGGTSESQSTGGHRSRAKKSPDK
jgi:hypothetical protein